jgi:hypothetical protein
MDEEIQKRFDRIEEEVLSRTTPEQLAAAQAPFLVPRETRTGVRYVRSRQRRRAFPRGPGNFCIGVLVLLSAAGVGSSLLLIREGAALDPWRAVLAVLYPLQIALDLAGFGRLTQGFLKWALGDLQLELSADRLRGGIRWGPWWFDSDSIPVRHLKRLVVVKRPAGKGDTVWCLVAETHEGTPATLLSADDPINVLPIAKDLHARLARRETASGRWPPLAEEDGPAEPDRPPRRPLLPGGGWTWLAVHVAGTAGLWQIGTLPWFKQPGSVWHMSVLVGLAIMQALILITNFGLLNMSRAVKKNDGRHGSLG